MSCLASPRVSDLESVRRRCARRLQRQLQSPELRAEKASCSAAPGSRSPTRALSPDIILDVSPEALAAAANAETRLRQPGSVPPARGSSSLRSPRGSTSSTHEEAESRPRMGRSIVRSQEDLAESCSEGRLPRSRSAPRILCSPQKEEVASSLASEIGEQSTKAYPERKEDSQTAIVGSNGGVSIRSLSAARHEARAERALGSQDKGIIASEIAAPELSPRGTIAGEIAAPELSPRGGSHGDSLSGNTNTSRRDSRSSYGSYTAAPTRTSRGSYAPVAPLSPTSSRRPVASSHSQAHTMRSMRGSTTVPSGTAGNALATGSASISNGPAINGATSSSALAAKSLSATVPSTRRSSAYATPRSGLGGSMRSAVPLRAREAQAGSVRGSHASAGSQAVPPSRNRSPSTTLRATSSPLHGHVEGPARSRGTARGMPSYVPPQRSPRNSDPSTSQRKPIARVEHQQQAVPLQVTPLRGVAPGATLVDASAPSNNVQQTARVEQMSAVAQSLQAAALALQRVAVVSPGAPRTRGLRVREPSGTAPTSQTNGAVVSRNPAPGADTREATVAELAGAAQRVRADWLPSNKSSNNSGMLSVLSRENAALREALNDTTRKLNELSKLEGERQRLSDDPGIDTLQAIAVSASNGHEAVSVSEAAVGAPHVASAEVGAALMAPPLR